MAAIFLDFYNQHDQNICFYVCDFSDEKQHVRKRKFDEWYLQFDTGVFLKLDITFKGYDGSTLPASIIMVKDNKYKDELTTTVLNLLLEYNNEK